jgi:hypothetical protein
VREANHLLIGGWDAMPGAMQGQLACDGNAVRGVSLRCHSVLRRDYYECKALSIGYGESLRNSLMPGLRGQGNQRVAWGQNPLAHVGLVITAAKRVSRCVAGQGFGFGARPDLWTIPEFCEKLDSLQVSG